MGMQQLKLSEIICIFTDGAYRKHIIAHMSLGIHRDTLEQFERESDARKNQILSPILNRLDIILGDAYLAECMECDKGIDMVEVWSEPGMCTVIDVPDKRIHVQRRICSSIGFPLKLGQRKKEFPFAIIYDEPHQYLRSVELWKSVAVEARKYRLAYHWLFHSWEQIPFGGSAACYGT